eukprot:CAMPEP_0115026676 /NCGR_PEP_ID=MMETSP0216-20121206/34916_1 /TAXON_ID=223996 /ORGANISM="Protocruzia adherens, Strain Boccale" /LENGTH=62 /DNA_ID=CAMNT_0002401853 /DNA_START=192 /DNA_END=377 /DNA_ORIENTATION=-
MSAKIEEYYKPSMLLDPWHDCPTELNVDGQNSAENNEDNMQKFRMERMGQKFYKPAMMEDPW